MEVYLLLNKKGEIKLKLRKCEKIVYIFVRKIYNINKV